jgi:hypothetical protein
MSLAVDAGLPRARFWHLERIFAVYRVAIFIADFGRDLFEPDSGASSARHSSTRAGVAPADEIMTNPEIPQKPAKTRCGLTNPHGLSRHDVPQLDLNGLTLRR